MVRQHFDNSLNELQTSLIELSQLVERSISNATASLLSHDPNLIERVESDDDQIDDLTDFIEQSALNLIRTQQPVASDLRILMSIIHISVELERIGDYAEGLAHISSYIGPSPTIGVNSIITQMSELSSTMMKHSILALVNRDVALAQSVIESDSELDVLYKQNFKVLLEGMLNDSNAIEHGTYLTWAFHDFERIGDRAENIAERVVYLVTGNNRDSLT